MAHGIENRLDAQIVCNLLPGAGRLAEGQNIGRGGEFTDPVSIECTKFGEIRSRVFYCDPQHSDQKGGCEVTEVTHEFIHRVLA